MKIKCTALLLAVLPVMSGSAAFAITLDQIPDQYRANKLSVTVRCDVTLVAGDRIRYEYSLSSAPNSQQSLSTLALLVNSQIQAGGQPSGWDGGMTKGTSYWTWGPVDYSRDLSPGKTVSNFYFESIGLPSIQPFFAQGETAPPDVDDIPNGISEQEFAEGLNFTVNSQKGLTLAPSAFTIERPAVALIGFLISQVQQANSMGLVKNQGIANSLASKLAAANESLVQGNSVAAKNKLQAFSNEVSAQDSKGLDHSVAEGFEVIYEALLKKL